MKRGEKAEYIVAPNLAYGDGGNSELGIPPNEKIRVSRPGSGSLAPRKTCSLMARRVIAGTPTCHTTRHPGHGCDSLPSSIWLVRAYPIAASGHR
eukprot:scaffold13898_cov30-Tisochrysis_lutea.AAC.3